jgi:predicted AlkP superfamily pyrophosphatase or phosphodiesterase
MAATTILLSLDGFRAEYLERGITPNLEKLRNIGLSAKFMTPSFPSVTFPNHWTLVTGLYPSEHGLVANKFYDPEYNEVFHYTDARNMSMQAKWWEGGKPIWSYAEEAGVRAAVSMWPGSEVGVSGTKDGGLEVVEDGTAPWTVAGLVVEYKSKESLKKKVDDVLKMVDMAEHGAFGPFDFEDRMFIASYVPDVDSAGHKYGPDATEVNEVITKVDHMVGALMLGLEERKAFDKVNIVIVSDHGMGASGLDRMIQLDDIIDMDLIEHVDGWPLFGLRPKVASDLSKVHDTLNQAIQSGVKGFDVYTPETLPPHFHYKPSDAISRRRIAPLWVVPRPGWAITTREEFDVAAAKANNVVPGNAKMEWKPKGLHGYDPLAVDMRSIFLAKGPAFEGLSGACGVVEEFENVHVAGMIGDALGISMGGYKGRGRGRLPLKVVEVVKEGKGNVPWIGFANEKEEQAEGGMSAMPAPDRVAAPATPGTAARPAIQTVGLANPPIPPSPIFNPATTTAPLVAPSASKLSELIPSEWLNLIPLFLPSELKGIMSAIPTDFLDQVQDMITAIPSDLLTEIVGSLPAQPTGPVVPPAGAGAAAPAGGVAGGEGGSGAVGDVPWSPIEGLHQEGGKWVDSTGKTLGTKIADLLTWVGDGWRGLEDKLKAFMAAGGQ